MKEEAAKDGGKSPSTRPLEGEMGGDRIEEIKSGLRDILQILESNDPKVEG